jgi:hypothetical protein
MRGIATLALVGLVVGSGCAPVERMPPPTVDVTGTWAGTWHFEPVSVGSGTISMTLTQTGAAVRGPIEVAGPTLNRPTRVEGIVSGDTFIITGPVGNGSMTVKGDEMSGEINGFVPVKMTARRQR